MSNLSNDRKIVKLKDGEEVLLRLIEFNDLDNIWDNFNQVIGEKIYLPTYSFVVDTWEKKTWFEDITHSNNFCIVATSLKGTRVDNHILGQCTIENIQWDAAAHVGLLGIIIRKDFRNLGLGFHLIEFAKELSKKSNRKKLILSTFSTNIMAIHLYEKCGFKQVGLYKEQFLIEGKYIDEVLMECFL